ncbi:MFS transporter [Dictyobacter arantiisoli]|uniref:MFS transporter n=1 Tax=Dictyobacter arantiisoli TaxID=2014874 RepID=A0A5A5TAD6_9CHLR|nr:MFS transporter [Dictyobacter arantiisoli]GCF08382.1 MFS transporter [Dictyobacter arantiisoli]
MADASSIDNLSSANAQAGSIMAPDAHGEGPSKKVSVVFQVVYFLANLVANVILLPIIIYLIPHQILQLDPGQHVTSLSIVESIGGLFYLISAPLAGALSDRSTSVLGRRRFWMLIHMLCASLAIVLLANAPSIWLLIVGWSLLQFFGGALLTVLQAVLPDQVPVRQRGMISAYVGLAIPFAAVIGGVVVALAFKNTPLTSYYVFMVALIICILLFFAVLKDRPFSQEGRARFNLRNFLARFWINPRLNPDFAWALVTRLLLFLGYYAISAYLQYYIQDGLHYEQLFPGKQALQGTLQIQSIMTVMILIFSFTAGIVSDRWGRRKPVVIIASLLIALALFIPAILHTWTAMLIFAVLLGAGYGGYLAVDTALITQVLPTAEDRGKDLGIINLALSIPLIVSPLLAALLVNSLGYPALFGFSGLLAALGGILVVRIKSVA